MKLGHGGARAGAGKPKGHKGPRTIEKEEARHILRQLVMAKMQPLVDAQVANAMGIKYLVVREKGSGKFVRVTEAMARAKAGDAEEIIEIWEKDPSIQAFSDLMNRTIDKPADQVDMHVSGEQKVLITSLHLGRQKASDAKKQRQ